MLQNDEKILHNAMLQSMESMTRSSSKLNLHP